MSSRRPVVPTSGEQHRLVADLEETTSDAGCDEIAATVGCGGGCRVAGMRRRLAALCVLAQRIARDQRRRRSGRGRPVAETSYATVAAAATYDDRRHRRRWTVAQSAEVASAREQLSLGRTDDDRFDDVFAIDERQEVDLAATREVSSTSTFVDGVFTAFVLRWTDAVAIR